MYLENISKQIFLKYNKIVKLIFRAINACRRFAHYVEKLDGDLVGEMLLEDQDQLEKIAEDFRESFDMLLKIVSLFNKNLTSSYLYQLIIRLNFNEYYAEQANYFPEE